ncbi:cupin [Dyadobacter sp. UP-52]|uniref:Cupin n=2 Tax=Dyadobacter subterraneus TaxID=2773304 RepID=A0ABR9WC49_9BACT|nr:cupin [Dyadobacter subterraneus]
METKIETYFFKDDGLIPNSKYPLILYKNAFNEKGTKAGTWLEEHFRQNNWTNSWRNGVFTYHHYHSISHEVLGIYDGSATLLLGGESGQKLKISAGDIIVIPAGVGHKNLESSSDFKVLGAYPNGMDYDILRGKPEERKQADKNIASVPFPDSDPFLGKNEGLREIWKKIK